MIQFLLFLHFLRCSNQEVIVRYPAKSSIETDDAIVDEAGFARLRLHIEEDALKQCVRNGQHYGDDDGGN